MPSSFPAWTCKVNTRNRLLTFPDEEFTGVMRCHPRNQESDAGTQREAGTKRHFHVALSHSHFVDDVTTEPPESASTAYDRTLLSQEGDNSLWYCAEAAFKHPAMTGRPKGWRHSTASTGCGVDASQFKELLREMARYHEPFLARQPEGHENAEYCEQEQPDEETSPGAGPVPLLLKVGDRATPRAVGTVRGHIGTAVEALNLVCHRSWAG